MWLKLLPARLYARLLDFDANRTDLISLVKAYGIAHLSHIFLFELSVPGGPSMLPTINNVGEGLFVEKVSVWKQQIVVGDVVLAKSPRNPKDRIIKRVLGMEGDVVNVKKSSRRPNAEPVKVPAGYVWLQGDNTLNSTDSRDYGPVPYNLLMGRVLFRFFPLDRISWIERKVPAPFYG